MVRLHAGFDNKQTRHNQWDKALVVYFLLEVPYFLPLITFVQL